MREREGVCQKYNFAAIFRAKTGATGGGRGSRNFKIRGDVVYGCSLRLLLSLIGKSPGQSLFKIQLTVLLGLFVNREKPWTKFLSRFSTQLYIKL